MLEWRDISLWADQLAKPLMPPPSLEHRIRDEATQLIEREGIGEGMVVFCTVRYAELKTSLPAQRWMTNNNNSRISL